MSDPTEPPSDHDEDLTPVDLPKPRTRTRDREKVAITADDVGQASAVLLAPAPVAAPARETTDGAPPAPGLENASAPQPVGPDGQHGAYWVLSAEDRQAGFVRPVRRSYQHERCGTITTMGVKIAETYAAQPEFYGSTFCVHCKEHLPVGKDGEFVWCGLDGNPTTERVGT